jgi:hypothetical protein
VADDPVVSKQPLDAALVEAGDPFDLEAGERGSKVLVRSRSRRTRIESARGDGES